MSTTVTTYLEQLSPGDSEELPLPDGVSVRPMTDPPLDFYRKMYKSVGGPWKWSGRVNLGDDELSDILHDPNVQIFVLYVESVPAGFAEIDGREMPEVEVKYFGLRPSFIGQGLGPPFLDEVLRTIWRKEPERIWVHTCTDDHPHAVTFYERAGFEVYKETEEEVAEEAEEALQAEEAEEAAQAEFEQTEEPEPPATPPS